MPARIPESRRRAGVCYALTMEDIELPVVDITHPSFALALDDKGIAQLRARDIQDVESWSRKPRFIQRWIFGLARRRSVLLQGLHQAEGGFLSGLNTYLMKLGPDHLDPTFAKPLDARVAQGVPSLNVRLRLQHMAHLLAEALEPALERQTPRPIRLVNLAGGPAMDSLNALILLNKKHPESLRDRAVRIQVLDSDAAGPAFGARALEALSAPQAPLHGLAATLERQPYDWRHPENLAGLLEGIGDAESAGSSEGGLFEYGSDEEILANLEILRGLTPSGFTLSGSASLDLPHTALRNRSFIQLARRHFAPDQLRALATRGGWRVERLMEGPTTQCFRMGKA